MYAWFSLIIISEIIKYHKELFAHLKACCVDILSGMPEKSTLKPRYFAILCRLNEKLDFLTASISPRYYRTQCKNSTKKGQYFPVRSLY